VKPATNRLSYGAAFSLLFILECLRHYAASWKVAGSSSVEADFLN
jgi:hypothetical protein